MKKKRMRNKNAIQKGQNNNTTINTTYDYVLESKQDAVT